MKILKTIMVLCTSLVALLPFDAGAQGPPPRPGAPQRPNAQQQRQAARRDALELQVLNRFVKRTSDEMSLDQGQRTRLLDVVRNSSLKRKQLTQRTNELHRRMAVAIRDQSTSPETFTRLLADHQQLRRDEQQITDAEQNDLRAFLSPRQQALFLMQWIRLQENARAVQAQMGPDGPPLPGGRGPGEPDGPPGGE
jgi:hypothetical protein